MARNNDKVFVVMKDSCDEYSVTEFEKITDAQKHIESRIEDDNLDADYIADEIFVFKGKALGLDVTPRSGAVVKISE